MKNNNIAKTISMPKDIWNKIDELRGDIPRSKFILNLILIQLKGGLK